MKQPLLSVRKELYLSNPYAQYILFGLGMIILSYLAQLGLVQESIITIVAAVLYFSIVAIGMTVLLGYSGLISLGTAGFMGLSAYLTSYLTREFNLPFELSLIISVAFPVLLGLIVGLISLRLEGYYLAIATLGVAEILRKSFVEFYGLTGGFGGSKAAYPKLLGFLQLDKYGTIAFIAIVLTLIMILTHNFLFAQTGRALLTMRGSSAAAQAMGINIMKYRLIAFAVATIYTAIGGIFYAHFLRYTDPDVWRLTLSLNVVAIIVIGGMRSIWGAVLGSLVVYGIGDIVLKRLPYIGQQEGFPLIMTGFLIIIVILFYPNGLVNITRDIQRLYRKVENKSRIGVTKDE